jgi:hypothetical protein
VGKGNLARFLWNVMALDTSSNTTGAACEPFDKQCPAGQVSGLGWRSGFSHTAEHVL